MTYTLIRMGIFLLLIWLLNSLLLNLYTNHGQKLRLTNFVGQPLFKARKMAASRDYELVILDSVHLIGKPGGYVLNQVPKPNSFVKEGEKSILQSADSKQMKSYQITSQTFMEKNMILRNKNLKAYTT